MNTVKIISSLYGNTVSGVVYTCRTVLFRDFGL